MDEKRRSSKRKSMTTEEGFWDCSVCTYRNSPEAFKCEMCDVRKGTSTRKPRINPQVMQQVAQQVFTPPPLKKEKKEGSLTKKQDSTKKEDGREPSTSKESTPKSSSNKKNRPPRLKNIDRSTARSMEVTVGNVTVVITDYQPKKPSEPKHTNSATSPASSSSSKDKDSPSKGEDGSNKPSKVETVVNGEAAATKDES